MERSIYIFSAGRLKRKDHTLYFENDTGEKRPIPVEQTGSIHFFGSVDFNSSMLHLLTKHQICCHLYNYYGFYDGTYWPRKARVSGFTVVQQSAHVIDAQKRLYLAKCFVQSAFHHMLRNLRRSSESVGTQLHTLQSMEESINRAASVTELMGAEGTCRKIYYSAWNQLIKNGMQLDQRNKRPPRDPVNAMISFGNSLMYTAVLSELHKTVLDPTVSYLHEPSSRRFSLCLDIAEIFKPLVIDSIVLSLLNNRRIQEKHFETQGEAVYLNEEGRKRFLAAFDEKMESTIKHRKLNRNVSYRYLIRLEAYKLIKHVIGDETYKPFKAWW